MSAVQKNTLSPAESARRSTFVACMNLPCLADRTHTLPPTKTQISEAQHNGQEGVGAGPGKDAADCFAVPLGQSLGAEGRRQCLGTGVVVLAGCLGRHQNRFVRCRVRLLVRVGCRRECRCVCPCGCNVVGRGLGVVGVGKNVGVGVGAAWSIFYESSIDSQTWSQKLP